MLTPREDRREEFSPVASQRDLANRIAEVERALREYPSLRAELLSDFLFIPVSYIPQPNRTLGRFNGSTVPDRHRESGNGEVIQFCDQSHLAGALFGSPKVGSSKDTPLHVTAARMTALTPVLMDYVKATLKAAKDILPTVERILIEAFDHGEANEQDYLEGRPSFSSSSPISWDKQEWSNLWAYLNAAIGHLPTEAEAGRLFKDPSIGADLIDNIGWRGGLEKLFLESLQRFWGKVRASCAAEDNVFASAEEENRKDRDQAMRDVTGLIWRRTPGDDGTAYYVADVDPSEVAARVSRAADLLSDSHVAEFLKATPAEKTRSFAAHLARSLSSLALYEDAVTVHISEPSSPSSPDGQTSPDNQVGPISLRATVPTYYYIGRELSLISCLSRLHAPS